MNALRTLTATELRLFARTPTSVFMALLLPSLLLVLQGFVIPGMNEPMAGGSLRTIDLLIPIAFTVALLSVAVINYPTAIAGYRQLGVLRRLDVTPVGAPRVLFAQWIVSILSYAAAVAVTGAFAFLAFGASVPRNLVLVIAIIALGAVTMMAVGSIIAARAPSPQAANGIGMLVFIASLYTAGVWTPGDTMPETMRTVSGFTPLGAMSQSLTSAWYEGTATLAPILVMGAWALICSLLAIRLFRWR
ncbi:ABC transporter permease [Agromyces archimandritae]|uniref:Transport permease protein n=1 Tax=Agromyces archimandritae TaxID=2781962 RepID=A0A975IQ75_9MICO|nr:ABC transporter permease [Agromyces archimandritae]QTX06049.1 ABC transporter permease [Agromyces archimandritae]